MLGKPKQNGVVIAFGEDQWYCMLDLVTVFNKEDVRFSYKDGKGIKV